MRIFIFLLVALSSLLGCHSAQKVIPNDFNQGRWTGRLLVRDLKNSKSQVVHFEAQGLRDKVVRFELTASMGIPLAIFVIRPDETEYLLPREKKFISGPTTSKILSPVFTAPVDPNVLFTLFFDSSPANQWICEKDAEGQFSLCKSQDQQLTLLWKNRDGHKKTIEIAHKDAEIQMNINTFEIPSSIDPSAFMIKKPKGFKAYRLKTQD